MSNSIPAVDPLGQAAATQATVKHENIAQTKAPAPKPVADSIHISKTAQVHALKRNGESISRIAIDLGLDVKTVNNYLAVPVQKPIAAPAQQVNNVSEEAKENTSEKALETLQAK